MSGIQEPAPQEQERSLFGRLRPRHFLIPLAVLLAAGLAGSYGLLRASLPRLDGEIHLSAERGAPLSASVRISRDRLGVVSIEAGNRADLAFATGFAHAQDRFFQMDLSRRLAAGELSEIVGKAALEQDTMARRFRFRALSREILARLPTEQRVITDAYTRGVNAGLGSLASRPWEYWLLGSKPTAWKPEDSLLVAYAMWWDLQVSGFRREILRRELDARIGGAVCEGGWKCGMQFLYPRTTAWDAPVDDPRLSGDTAATVDTSLPTPAPEVLDVRGRKVSWTPPPGSLPQPQVPMVGSNNWVVGGAHTPTGAALLANDMHLGQRVPAVWYHARLILTGHGHDPALDLNGVTLPGTPLLVAGSNGHVAWGFTNSYGNWLDVTRVPCTAVEDQRLMTAAGPVPLTVVQEEIRVHGGASEILKVKSGPAGLLLQASPEQGVCWFGHWLAENPEAVNLGLMQMERVGTVSEALALAPSFGMPHQNLVVGDRDGHIGWTIGGRIPAATGAARMTGQGPWLEASDFPHIYDPPLGRIWTANARVTADAHAQAQIAGDNAQLGSQYDFGARAQQIRDDLLALKTPATPADMLHIQLDDRAVLLTRWHDLLLKLLDDDAVKAAPQRAELKALLSRWDGHASPDSVGYRLVRTYHDTTQRAVWQMLLKALDIPVDENALVPERFEAPLWHMVTEQPMHLLAPSYGSWRELLLAQVDATIGQLDKDCGRLAGCTWGHGRAVRIRHPLSGALPWLSGLLDMPTLELPGDHDMPRVQGTDFGASERFAVSPGHEADGYMHFPGGQSGHPLSPYYRSSFAAWAQGVPQPFLPGPAEHQLTLRP